MQKLKDVLFDYNNFCGYAMDALKRQETGDYDEEGALDEEGDNAPYWPVSVRNYHKRVFL